MKPKIKLLVENFTNNKKTKNLWKYIVLGLSCIVIVFTFYILLQPAKTEYSQPTSTLKVRDHFINDGSTTTWKPERENFDIKIHYVVEDASGKESYITGPDIKFNVGSNTGEQEDVAFGFGVQSAYNLDFADVAKDINTGKTIKTLTTTEGDKFSFLEAEVKIGDTYYPITTNISGNRHFYCQKSGQNDATYATKPIDEIYGWGITYWNGSKEVSIFLHDYINAEKEEYTEDFITDLKVTEEDVVKYTNIEIKFKYKRERLGANQYSDSSLGSEIGVKFTMFDYTDHNTNSKSGINNNGVYEYFTFINPAAAERATANGKSDPIKRNEDMDKDGYQEVKNGVIVNRPHATVEKTLNERGYPEFYCRGLGCTINGTTQDSFSLGYLFGDTQNPLGQTPNGVTKYEAQNTLLQKNSNGYYYYSSNSNAVDYDKENNRFILRDYVELSEGMVNGEYSKQAQNAGKNITYYEFLPFNYHVPSNCTTSEYCNENVGYHKDIDVNHWNGMTMEFDFVMPADGKTENGEDMIFKFSGDDDVWVFIDGVLVLELGGIHGAVDGSINFATGEVKGYYNFAGLDFSDSSKYNIDNIYQDSIKQAFQEAGRSVDGEGWNSEEDTFADWTTHKLQFYYLERGANVSNCTMEFNMPVLPPSTLTVEKKFEEQTNGTLTKENEYYREKYKNESYTFRIYDVTNEEATPLRNVTYTLIGKNNVILNSGKKTTNEGIFTLQNNQKAQFSLTEGHKYRVEEIIEDEEGIDISDHYEAVGCSVDGVACPEGSKNQTGDVLMKPADTHYVIIRNEVRKLDLEINKEIYPEEETDEEFDFKITLTQKVMVDNQETNKPIEIASGTGYTANAQGIVTFNLKNGATTTIKNIPYDTYVNLKELNHDGYSVVIKTGDGQQTLANGDEYNFLLNTEGKSIKVVNMPGRELPATGGPGIYKYLIIGLGLILTSIIGGIYIFFHKEEGGG